MIDAIVKILGVSKNSYWNYRKQQRPIMFLLEKYFTKEDLQEFLNTGKISKLEDGATNTNDLEIVKALDVDNAIYSAKDKLQRLEGKFTDWVYNKGSIDILKDVLTTIEEDEITIENAKETLFARIKGYDANWISLKNPGKQRLLGIFIDKYFSKLECYAICKYSDEVFNYKGLF